jgi:hypothetical protein
LPSHSAVQPSSRSRERSVDRREGTGAGELEAALMPAICMRIFSTSRGAMTSRLTQPATLPETSDAQAGTEGEEEAAAAEED